MKNNGYSRLQYILWLISGSEISILKKCPTDFNRHAGIGFTIFMTSLFGAFAGGYAGFYFSQSVAAALCFGLLWGLLIFSIDRTMVVSLKKRPQTNWKQHLGQILFRAILAALIAFIISIPLELLVFKDNIDAGKAFYQQSQLLQLNKGYDSLFRPDQDEKVLQRATQQSKAADSISGLDPQDAAFRSQIQSLNEKEGQLSMLFGERAKEKGIGIRYYNQSLVRQADGTYKIDRSSNSYTAYLASRKRQMNLNASIGQLKNEVVELKKEVHDAREQWRDKYKAEGDNAKKRAKDVAEEIESQKMKTDSATIALDEVLKKTENSFVVRFDVLSFLANKKNSKGVREFASIFFLLWLIRVLFFVIEILPTIVKISTPFGAYDAAIYEAEENFKNIKLAAARELLQDKVKRQHQTEIEERDRQVVYRMKKEAELHDKLVDEISVAQNLIATKVLEDWKQVNMRKVDS